MSEEVKYNFLKTGTTTGAVTGLEYAWRSGDTITAPEGEFSHLPDRDVRYKTRPVRPEPVPDPDAPEIRLEEEKVKEPDISVEQRGRWFYVYRGDDCMNHLVHKDGEDKGISEDDAESLVQNLKGES